MTYLNHHGSSLFGAPLGGWSRASRSRLAALPLRLVGDSVFWQDQQNAEEGNIEINTEEHSKRVETGGPYFTMRDGIGRKFVCHIYDEKELSPKSMSESMFDAPIFRINIGEEVSEESTSFDSIPGEGNIDSSHKMDDADLGDYYDEDDLDLSLEPAVELVLTHDLDEYLEGKGINLESQLELSSTKYKYDYHLDTSRIIENLKKLKGTCASLHTGWWSYEWCDLEKITQFHVQLQGNELSEVLSVQDLMPEFVLQSISTIGTFTKRKIVVETANEHFMSDTLFNRKSSSEEGTTIEADVSDLLVVDSFENGEYCEEADAHRKVEVRLKCCNKSELLSSLKKGALQNIDFFTNSFNKNSDAEARALFVNVHERAICDYVAYACTNVLCEASVEDEENDAGIADFKSVDNAEIQRDDSIRSILDKKMGEMCLKKNEGWWTYRFCYQSTIHQFHESVDIDVDRGTMKTTIEAENILGKYDPMDTERFPNEEEINHVFFPEGKRLDDAGDREDVQQTPQILGVDAPCFVQEYTEGDLCEGSDVIDSAIRGGEVGEGGIIQRSTTVRYFCGDTRELIRINEDHTCHYVIDISVPELCYHKYFEIPHIYKHAVKCLPVE